MRRARHSFFFVWVVLFACLALFTQGSRAQGPSLVINEILVGNAGTTLDTDYTNFSAWIELLNTTGSTINLEKYKIVSLRDGAAAPDTYVIPRLTLPANARLILWADENRKGPHLPFELDMDGGELSLFTPTGNLVTSLVYGEQSPDVSYGRSPEGSDTWAYFDQPTPGAANTTPAFANNNNAAFAARPQFSVAGGVHSDPLAVELSSTDAGATIRYTTDGSRPTVDSPVYTGSIAINQTTLLRARAWAAGKMVSLTATQTYLFGVNTSLPIVSLVTNDAYLNDDKIGIYVKGTNGILGCKQKNRGNWNQSWERPANIEFFETNGAIPINQEVGLEISGHCSRSYPRKSLEVKARKTYGDNDLDYPFFSDKPMTSYRRLILRNSGQDIGSTLFRDALAQNLAIGIDLDRQAYRPAVLYLNGQYWGIYNMREKMDEDYVENNYDLDEDEFDMLVKNGSPISGNSSLWTPFYSYILKSNPAIPSVYETIANRLDIDAFIDYIIMETYAVNVDWPGTNARYWDDRGNLYKWRWVLNDFDHSFGLNAKGAVATNALKRAITFSSPVSKILKQLLKNPEFKHEFSQRYAVRINTTFEQQRVIGFIDGMADRIRPEMPNHIARWGSPTSVATWEGNVQKMRVFAAQRPAIARQHLFSYFGASGATLRVEIEGDGRVLVAGADVPDGYSGLQLRGVPMTLTAIPAGGSNFSHWLETGEASPTITIPFAGDTTRTAVFGEEPPPPPTPPLVINELHHTPSGDDNTYEFLELYNAGTEPVDLSGYTIFGVNPPSGATSPFPAGSSIAPGEYIVVADTPASYAGQGYQVYDFDGGLSSSGEEVTLRDTLSRVVDTVTYQSIAPWPATPNAQGPSLSLNDPTLDNTDPNNWSPSRENGGTPGAENFPPILVPPVVINEIHYSPTGGAAEFIELYNDGLDDVALDGFTFEGVEYTFPAGTNLPAGGYLVIPSSAWTGGDLSDAGETIALMDGTAEVDSVTYGSADPWPAGAAGSGPSLSLGNPGLDNSLAASWAASRETGGTPGAANFPPLPIVVNELHHTPAGDDNTYEFLELFNAGSEPFDLTGYTFVGVTFTFPAGSSIAPGEYMVVADTPATYAGQGYQVFDFSGGLSGDGETIALRDLFGNEVDSVTYGVDAPWASTPNGGGPSLSLLNPALDNALPESWAASAAAGGTPGAANNVP